MAQTPGDINSTIELSEDEKKALDRKKKIDKKLSKAKAAVKEDQARAELLDPAIAFGEHFRSSITKGVKDTVETLSTVGKFITGQGPSKTDEALADVGFSEPDAQKTNLNQAAISHEEKKTEAIDEASVQVEQEAQKNVTKAALENDPVIRANAIAKYSPESSSKEKYEANILLQNPKQLTELTQIKQQKKQPLTPAEAIALGISTIAMPLIGEALAGDDGLEAGYAQGMSNMKAYHEAVKAQDQLELKQRELDIEESRLSADNFFRLGAAEFKERKLQSEIERFKQQMGLKKLKAGEGRLGNDKKARFAAQTARKGLNDMLRVINPALSAGKLETTARGLVSRLASFVDPKTWSQDAFQESNVKVYRQAAQSVTNAILRYESGAAIGKEELKNKIEELIPSQTDSFEEVQNKISSMTNIINALEQAGGMTKNVEEEKQLLNYIIDTAKSPIGGAKSFKNMPKFDKNQAARELARRRMQ